MDGASRMFAGRSMLTLKGVEYEIAPKIGKFYAEMEAFIRSFRPGPFGELKKAVAVFDGDDPVSEAMRDRLARYAMEQACQARFVSGDEINEWMATVHGTAFCTWLSIRHNDPEFRVECPSTSATTITREFVMDAVLEEIESAASQLVETLGESADGTEEQQATDGVVSGLHDVINRASGEDQLGNSIGPAEETSPQPGTQETTDLSESPGGESADA